VRMKREERMGGEFSLLCAGRPMLRGS
jgi:hypothetical protein